MQQYKRIQLAKIRREETEGPRAQASMEQYAAEQERVRVARRAEKAAETEAAWKRREATDRARRKAVVAVALDEDGALILYCD